MSFVFILFYVLFVKENLSHAEEVSTLSFFQLVEGFKDITKLEPFHNQRVEVCGFLYKTEKNRWVLAKEPNLKSCCVGKAHKVSGQIFLAEDFNGQEGSPMVTLQGKFCIAPRYQENGDFYQFYMMSDLSFVSEKRGGSPWIPLLWLSFLLLALAFVTGFLIKRLKP